MIEMLAPSLISPNYQEATRRLAETRQRPPCFSAVFYTQITNGAEQPDERPPATFGPVANLSTGFSTREGHHRGGPGSLPFGRRPARRLPWSSPWEVEPSGRPQ